MTNKVDRVNDRLDRAIGENCLLDEVAIQTFQNEPKTTPIYIR